jgi:CheY-like chemotaxis protein
MRTLIATVQVSVRDRFIKRSRELLVEVPPYLPDCYLGDQRVIRSVLSSLLFSALESCDGNGVSVTVTVKEKSPSGLVIQFSVGFTCGGVPFSRYEIMCDYLGRQGSTGMADNRPEQAGLSLAAALVNRLGGKIWVKSTVNRGRTFCFSVHLPESASHEPALSRDGSVSAEVPGQEIWNSAGLKGGGAEGARATPARILLAEDSVIDQLALRRLLENRGVEVTCVSNGREAVDEFDCAFYDAVLMDILMPEMDGFEATRLIREKERVLGSHTPIIALTAYSLKAVHDKCVSVGMDGYLSKPVSSEELVKLFDRLPHAENGTPSEPRDRDLPLLDIRDTITNLGDDENLYREIIVLFSEKAPVIHAELLEAIRTGTCEEVTHLAHKLKGMSSNIGAKRYAALVGQIQDSSLAGILADSSLWLNTLAVEFRLLQNALAAINPQELPLK